MKIGFIVSVFYCFFKVVVQSLGLGSHPGFPAWVLRLGSYPGFSAWARRLGSLPGFSAWVLILGSLPGFSAWLYHLLAVRLVQLSPALGFTFHSSHPSI